MTSIISPQEISTTAMLFMRTGTIYFMSDWKKVKIEEKVQYFVTFITNFRPVFTERKEGQLNCNNQNSDDRSYLLLLARNESLCNFEQDVMFLNFLIKWRKVGPPNDRMWKITGRWIGRVYIQYYITLFGLYFTDWAI